MTPEERAYLKQAVSEAQKKRLADDEAAAGRKGCSGCGAPPWTTVKAYGHPDPYVKPCEVCTDRAAKSKKCSGCGRRTMSAANPPLCRDCGHIRMWEDPDYQCKNGHYQNRPGGKAANGQCIVCWEQYLERKK